MSNYVSSVRYYQGSVYLSCLDTSIYKYEPLTGILLFVFNGFLYFLFLILEGHEGAVNNIIFYRDFMLSSSNDLTLIQWRLDSGDVVVRLRGNMILISLTSKGHSNWVINMAFVSNTVFVSQSYSELIFWDITKSRIIYTYYGT
jgi:WD40 repeat protein